MSSEQSGKRKRRVSWAPSLTVVHTLPPTVREQEPAFVSRMLRSKALADTHDARFSRALVSRYFGNGRSTAGKFGRYTDQMARRNLWHAKQFGGAPWYQWDLKHRRYPVFESRYTPSQEAKLVAAMAASGLK